MKVISKSDLENIENMKQNLIKQHEAALASLPEPAVYEITQNTDDTPRTLNNGIVVLPGDYHSEEIGIEASELENHYQQV